MINTKKCLICKGGKANDCVYWHSDPNDGSIWCYCTGKCQRGYSLYEYCAAAGLSLKEFLKADFTLQEANPTEVQAMGWPSWFLPLFDSRAKKGFDYVKSRGLDPGVGDMFYDTASNAIVFPYYFGNTFVGAQMRLIEPKVNADGDIQKMDTIPGTRLSLLVYNFAQQPLPTNIKGIIVTEGAFNALSLQQALNKMYGGIANNPWRCWAFSGSGLSDHKSDILKEQMEAGRRVILAPDSDAAGLKMLKKAEENGCLTHYALPEDTDKDWNRLLVELGEDGLGKYLLSRIKPV
jgi:hypothetical protein